VVKAKRNIYENPLSLGMRRRTRRMRPEEFSDYAVMVKAFTEGKPYYLAFQVSPEIRTDITSNQLQEIAYTPKKTLKGSALLPGCAASAPWTSGWSRRL